MYSYGHNRRKQCQCQYANGEKGKAAEGGEAADEGGREGGGEGAVDEGRGGEVASWHWHWFHLSLQPLPI